MSLTKLIRSILFAALAALSLPAQTQPAAQPAQAQPQWKDQAEYDMYSAVQKETDPKKKLPLLQAWSDKYPDSQFKQQRLVAYLNVYQQLNDVPKLIATLKQMLDSDPKNLQLMQGIMFYAMQSNDTGPANLEQAEKAANGALANLDVKPAGVPDDQWPKYKPQVEALAHTTLGWVAMNRKNNTLAEEEFLKSLKVDPNQGQVDLLLAGVLRAQKTPEKIAKALFFYARAAAYDGPGSLPAQIRQTYDDYLRKAYNSYHGQDDAGLTAIKTMAKSQPFPPDDFKVESAQEVASRQQQEFAKSNPQLAMWLNLKKELTGPNGQQFFESSMKGAMVPGGAGGVQKFKGTIIEAKPAVRSKELVVGLADPKVPEITLKLDAPLTGKPELGCEIEFEGVPSAFTADPFNITFDAEKAKITGLKMQAAPTTVRKKTGASKK
jgi:tetratricopeptide (TPR) repeat protein